MSRELLLKKVDPNDRLRNTDPPVVSLGVSERQPPSSSFDLDSLKISAYLNTSNPIQASSSTNQPQNVPLRRSNSLFEIRRKPLPFSVKPEAVLRKLGLRSHSKDTEMAEELGTSIIDKSEELQIGKNSGPRPAKFVASSLNSGRLSTIQELTNSPDAPSRVPPLIPEQVSPPKINLESRSPPDAVKPDIHLLDLNYERLRPISSFEGRALGSSPTPSVGQRRWSERSLTSMAIRDLATGASSSSMVPGNSFVASTAAITSVDMDVHKYPSTTVATTATTTMPPYSRPAGPHVPPSRELAVARSRQQHHRNENLQNLRQHGMRQRGMVDLDGYVAFSREDAEWYRVICRRILHEDTGARSHIFTGRPNRPRDGSEYGSIDGAVGRNRGGTNLRGRGRGGRGLGWRGGW